MKQRKDIASGFHGLSDGFEVEYGLDPNKVSTDGITNDGERKIDQVIADDGISVSLRDDENVAKPSLSGKAEGEIADNVFLAIASDSAFESNRSLVGDAVCVDGEDSDVSGLTLSFDLSAYESDLLSLSIVKLNADGNFELVESTVHEETISCNLSEAGTYCVLDIIQSWHRFKRL
ncbi:MAG: hypothetical protein LUE11_10825 [Clostridia bacterium]|nr:hypothetical protein [Clostridia bacterium]